MSNILETIAADTRGRVDLAKAQVPLADLKRQAQAAEISGDYPFEAALATSGLSVIAEVKKASPSKGLIASDFDYLVIASDYVTAGAAAISVLTEPNFFMGSLEYLRQIANAVPLPVLRKDFIIDEYQIYESKVLGAAAILLICSLLTDDQLAAFLATADSLGLSCLVEAHDAPEVQRALAADARIIGVNNRDLATFNVDVSTSRDLRELVPPDILFVSESGIQTPEDAAQLATYGVDAVLIGESLMRSSDKRGFISRIQQLAQQGTVLCCVSRKRNREPSPVAHSLTKIKICGLSREQDIDYVNAALPDYVGFVLAPSKRQVSPEQAAALSRKLDSRITPVGVFVDAPVEQIVSLYRNDTIKIAQLHGNESDEYIAELKARCQVSVIKAVSIDKNSEKPTLETADYLLFDYKEPGSGKSFDWELLKEIKKKIKQPFFLAGGINLDNITTALGIEPYCVDISSGAETDGVKDAAKIAQLVRLTRDTLPRPQVSRKTGQKGPSPVSRKESEAK